MSIGNLPFDDAKLGTFSAPCKYFFKKLTTFLIYVNAGVSIFCQHPHFCYL